MAGDDLPENTVREIADYLLIDRTELGSADLCLIFGNRYVSDKLAATGAMLYQQGLCKKIVASGGVLTDDGRTEAAAIRDELVRLGVPEKDILVEDKAMHTGENVAYSKALVERELGPDAVHSVIGVGHISAGRRFLMTMAKQWPEVLPMQVSVNPYPVSPADWTRHEGFKQQVMNEWNKIAAYRSEGFIEEVDIDRINRSARNLPPRDPGPGPAPAP
ncbi:MAG TPA: YdcF family protein [Patescibacteria group bacterium]|nr:YdcF family protein [Patescibacteria group bacterium]